MAICKIMLMDFWLGNPQKTEPGYTDEDLRQGVLFGQWLLDDGITKWPLFGFSIRRFIKWAKVDP